ncbi:52 kDa repressor of the inhibitor of the protein kinase-like [Aphis craccivora]|uniref:52 kDa repressor of the inhibitor of the protein kinase-like n=1 Tax=Aphis craccivora TaxID=307492 RepID=A0A6G0Z044_APHCR|nr:52 kDa repressor of the inhibitor of the protein kinase-like [Aphis craccivora]
MSVFLMYFHIFLVVVFIWIIRIYKLLQKEIIDLKEVIGITGDVVIELKSIRSNCTNELKNIFSQAQEMAEKIELELTAKRLCKR